MADLTLALLDGGHGYLGRAVRRLEELCALGRTSDATAARRAEPTGAAGPFGACEVAASAVGAASAEEAAAGTAGAAASRDRRGAAPSGRGASRGGGVVTLVDAATAGQPHRPAGRPGGHRLGAAAGARTLQ